MKEKWNKWQEKRRVKAIRRYKKQQVFKKKHPFIANVWKKSTSPLIWITILVALTFIGLLLYSMYDQYKTSVYWADHHDERVAMSEQPPSLMYDTDLSSRTAKMNFVSIYHTIYDDNSKDFTDAVEQPAIEQLKMELDLMTDDEYRKEYDEMLQTIGDKWHIERLHRNLYEDEKRTTLKETTSPQDIIEVNRETFEIVHRYAIDSRNNDGFATRIYEWQNSLLEDAVTLGQVTLTLENWLTKKETGWEVQPDLYPTQFETYAEEIKSIELNYTWASMNKLNAIVESIRPITKLHAERNKIFNEIEEDKELHRQAKEEVDQKLATANANLQLTISNIDRERTDLTQQIEYMRNRQVELANSMEQLEEDAIRRREERQLADERARQAEEERRRLAQEREQQLEEVMPPSAETPGNNSPEQPSEEEPEETYPEYEELIGKPAMETLLSLDYTFTYQRIDDIDLEDEEAIINRYVVKDNGEVHFFIAKR